MPCLDVLRTSPLHPLLREQRIREFLQRSDHLGSLLERLSPSYNLPTIPASGTLKWSRLQERDCPNSCQGFFVLRTFLSFSCLDHSGHTTLKNYFGEAGKWCSGCHDISTNILISPQACSLRSLNLVCLENLWIFC